MGYSHYFYRPAVLSPKKFKEFSKDCKKIFEYSENQLGIELANGLGDINSDPTATSSLINFNGSNTQPIGVWTTQEKISIPWPSDNASLTTPKESPTVEKTEGQWFAGDLLCQRVAPSSIINIKEIVEKLYDRARNKEELTEREKRFLTKYSDKETIEFGSGDYETVHIPRLFTEEFKQYDDKNPKLLFSCCKTAYRPYDLIVTAVLISLKYHFPECKIHSDGVDKDWQDGRILCQNLLGYGVDFSLDED